MLLLDKESTLQSLSIESTIQSQIEVFKRKNLHDTPHRTKIESTLFMPGSFGSQIGIKIVSIKPCQQEKTPASISLINNETGKIECIMNGGDVTTWRTAAGSAIVTDALAVADATVLV